MGPRINLHPGVHHSLTSGPPAGVSYQERDARHIFLFPGAGNRPHRDPHWGEFLDFGTGNEIVHSARWPVLNRGAWVADTDDLQVPMVVGRQVASPHFRRNYREPVWSGVMRRNVRRRIRNMLAAYAHGSCRAILFRSRCIAESASQWLATVAPGRPAEAMVAKSKVLYPAQKPLEKEQVLRKWGRPEPMRILFCGREYETKNGLMALRIMARLRRAFENVECIYIGGIPADKKAQDPALFQGLRYYESLPREAVLNWVAQAHVLFHPSKFEGLGTVFLEAAAAGLAVVSAKGGSMRHLTELFDGGGALLVDRDEVAEAQEEAAFEESLRRLLTSRSLARTLGLHNYRNSITREWSLERRDRTLQDVYAEAVRNPAKPLTIEDLPYRSAHGVLTLESAEVRADEKSYCRAIGTKPGPMVF